MKIARFLVFFIVAIAIFILSLQIAFSSPSQQTAAEIANPAAGQTAYEFVAQIDQTGFDLTIYGYLTQVNGLVGDALFVEGTDPAGRGEASAYLTMQATGTLNARSILQPIFATNAELTLTIYYNNSPAASFEDSASFAAGTPVATSTIRLQNILNVQAPDLGIANSTGESVQTESTPFSLNGRDVQFGRVGMTARLNAFGQGFRQSEEPLSVRLITAGNAIVIGQGQ
jgi:hypothetical protein